MNFKVAIKVFDKAKHAKNIDIVAQEISSLQQLDHPHIVKYFEIYSTDK